MRYETETQNTRQNRYPKWVYGERASNREHNYNINGTQECYKQNTMRKFNKRESHVLIEAMKTQRDQTIKHIQEMEKEGKRSMFTENFIKREHNDLIEMIEGNTKKR